MPAAWPQVSLVRVSRAPNHIDQYLPFVFKPTGTWQVTVCILVTVVTVRCSSTRALLMSRGEVFKCFFDLYAPSVTKNLRPPYLYMGTDLERDKEITMLSQPTTSKLQSVKFLEVIVWNINQSISLHFLSLGLIRGVNRQ